MSGFLNTLTDINSAINDFVWVKSGLFLLIGTGIIMTILTKFFQIVHIKEWVKSTIGSLFNSKTHKKEGHGSVSQFQALCTALAGTIGTGNIAGVSAAIAIGGPGAVFWMWVAAFFGMMTNFAENVLGIYYRRKNEKGEWSGGAMYYLRDGLGKYKGCKTIGRILAVAFSICTILASFGIGNIGQINKITINLESAFLGGGEQFGYVFGDVKWTSLIIGVVLMIIAALVIFGGLQRIAATTEKVVPFMAILYILGCLVTVCFNIGQIGAIFASIFRFAFGVPAVTGGIAGIVISKVVTEGCKRGVFSNEAGLGSSVMVNSASSTKEPVVQGMWGIFQVFADTIVVCTMTALVVLSSGAINLETGMRTDPKADGSTFVAEAFGNTFGIAGEMFVAVCVLLFAFTTVLGWSHYGTKAVEYLFGVKAGRIYKVIFVPMIIAGAIMTSSIAWDISDTFNGMMMIPNLIGVLALSPLVIRITKNYVDRKIKGRKDVVPMLSAIPEIQNEHAAAVLMEETDNE
ncbi:MAG: alanine:cation symporter family protein [Ruminiclostridium sp.]|nr:alanine:cation symporter family protein [Ruminiclostridium sp.]